jgi:hypothetical protein
MKHLLVIVQNNLQNVFLLSVYPETSATLLGHNPGDDMPRLHILGRKKPPRV